jgi:hypothetical protein
MVKRRKVLLGMGSLAAGSAAALGTGAYKGADVEADRSLTVSFEDDSAALLQLEPSSPFATQNPPANTGGVEGATGVGDPGGETLEVEVSSLNVNADTRLNDVFRVQNTTGSSVDLTIADDPAVGKTGAEPVFIHADDGSSETRIDDGSGVSLGPGEQVEINMVFNFKDNNVNSLPDTLIVNAQGAT